MPKPKTVEEPVSLRGGKLATSKKYNPPEAQKMMKNNFELGTDRINYSVSLIYFFLFIKPVIP